MRLLADIHIAPRTVSFLRDLGHDIIRVDAVLPSTASDSLIVATARDQNRTILTQDLDFSAILALAGQSKPSLISLRLSTGGIDQVNATLARVLPQIESDLQQGCIVGVEDQVIRIRALPLG